MTRRDLTVFGLLGALAGALGEDALAEDDVTRTAVDDSDLAQRCEREVEELHQFFQQWFCGVLESTDAAFERFASVIDDGFVIISPGGRMTRRASLIAALRGAHGSWGSPDGGKIWIENFQLHRTLGDVALVTYEEWQQRDTAPRGRLSSALFGPRPGTANDLAWLHLHEVWIPNH